MKKASLLLLTLAVFLPTISFATPAETAGVAPSPVDFNSLKSYLRTRDFNQKQYDNGLREWEFTPYVYTQERLQYKNVETQEKPEFPGIEYGKLCYHWKNCVKRIYKASNGYDQAYKNYTPEKVVNKGLDLAFTNEKKSVPASDVRTGKYKLLNWNFGQNR